MEYPQPPPRPVLASQPRQRSRAAADPRCPGRLSLLLGDANALGIGHPEPDWSPLPKHLHHAQLERDEHDVLRANQTAMSVLQDAGFIDAAHHFGDDRPTGGFGTSDVERRQDLFLLSPDLTQAVVSYEVHTEPMDHGWSDHCAVSLTLRLPESAA